MTKTSIRLATILFLLGGLHARAIPRAVRVPEAALEIDLRNIVAGKPFRGKLPVKVRIERDHVYGRAMTYKAYRLKDILNADNRVALLPHADYRIDFIGSDGYRATADLLRIWEGRNLGYVAFRDLSVRQSQTWAPIKTGRETTTPEPFYLVWKDGREYEQGFPWPYKLVSIEILKKDLRGPSYPQAGSVLGGYSLFRLNCSSCHAVNTEGGAVGPELNVPMNVTEYFVADKLPLYIKNAGSFHLGTHMPAFEMLSDNDVSAIIAYLTAMKEQKICKDAISCNSSNRD